MSIFLKMIYRINAVPTKIPANVSLFEDIEKVILKFMNMEGYRIFKMSFKKENKVEVLTISVLSRLTVKL